MDVRLLAVGKPTPAAVAETAAAVAATAEGTPSLKGTVRELVARLAADASEGAQVQAVAVVPSPPSALGPVAQLAEVLPEMHALLLSLSAMRHLCLCHNVGAMAQACTAHLAVLWQRAVPALKVEYSVQRTSLSRLSTQVVPLPLLGRPSWCSSSSPTPFMPSQPALAKLMQCDR